MKSIDGSSFNVIIHLGDYMILSVKKCMRILNVLSSSGEGGLNLCDIAQMTNINKSTCSHILKTLESENFVEQPNNSRRWRIGYGTYYLTRHGKYNQELCDISHSVLQWLNKNTGCTCVLCVLRSGKRICIDYVVGDVSLESGNIIIENLFNASSGRVLLANLPAWELKNIIDKYGFPSYNDWNLDSHEQLLKELKVIREQKYSAHHRTFNDTVSYGYSVPIMYDKNCIAALGLASLNKITDDNIKYLKSAATEISRRCKFKL